MKKSFIDKKTREIFYHIVAWMEDEGDYQPTEEEAWEKVREILQEAITEAVESLRVKRKNEDNPFKEGEIIAISEWKEKEMLREWFNAKGYNQCAGETNKKIDKILGK